MIRTEFLCAGLLVILLGSTANAQQFHWFDVSEFDMDVARTDAGQLLQNVHGDIDMLARGQSPGVIKVRPTNIVSVNDFMQSTCFSFQFDEPLNLYLDVESVDSLEVLKISSMGEMSYSHSDGAFPMVAVTPGSDVPTLPGPTGRMNTMMLTGNGTGFESDGAARGTINLGWTSRFGWCHRAQADEKSEALSIGVLAVPEPNTFVALLCALMMPLWRCRCGKQT